MSGAGRSPARSPGGAARTTGTRSTAASARLSASGPITGGSSRRGGTTASSRAGTSTGERKNKTKDINGEEMRTLRGALRLMMAEILNEKKLLNDFQQQKVKIEIFWNMEKKRRDDAKMELRNKLRQKQDLEEKHAFELKVYKQKVKHLLHEQQSNMTDVKTEGQTALKLLQDDERDKQHELSLNNRSIKVARKQMELAHYNLIKSIKQEQEKKIMAMREEFERKAEELKCGYEKKMKTVRDVYDEKRKEDTSRIEQRKTKHINKLISKHKRAFDEIKKYYRSITHTNLELINSLKEDVADMRKKEQGVQKDVNEIRRKNKRLNKPLARNRKLVEDLQTDKIKYAKDKISLYTVKENLTVLEERMKNQAWEHEILEQKTTRLRGHRDELHTKRESAIYDVQQKTGFRNLLLEKKIEALSQDLEKTESALSEVLASTNLTPEVVGQLQTNLEDVLMAKNKTIQKLEDSLVQSRRQYAETIRLYEEKLREHSIPVEELGFTPVRSF